MARPWESALHFEPTISCLTLRPKYPKDISPKGRVVSRSDAAAVALALPFYSALVVAAALVLLL